jgi:hypothetical protein
MTHHTATETTDERFPSAIRLFLRGIIPTYLGIYNFGRGASSRLTFFSNFSRCCHRNEIRYAWNSLRVVVTILSTIALTHLSSRGSELSRLQDNVKAFVVDICGVKGNRRSSQPRSNELALGTVTFPNSSMNAASSADRFEQRRRSLCERVFLCGPPKDAANRRDPDNVNEKLRA